MTVATSRRLRIRVLGPVRAWTGDEGLHLGTPQQRAVLTALALREGRQATLAALADAVWGEEPPRTSALTLRTYISRLRQAFGAGVIVTVNGGYLLRLDPGSLDLADFTAAVDRARAARDAGEHGAAALALHEADTLWQGPALADVPGPYAASQRVRLNRERHTAIEERLALDVGSNRVGAAVTELSALVEQDPLDEGLSALLMLDFVGRAGRLMESMADAHPVEPAGYQRYRYLDIVRWFARRQAIAAHTPAYREAVVARAATAPPRRALRVG